ncbi:MAG TPA: hypothetical protein VJZ71_07585 [Phycisphaerae bacterium]|nr:hypothetical protein [Phycisphaerae bacterium]
MAGRNTGRRPCGTSRSVSLGFVLGLAIFGATAQVSKSDPAAPIVATNTRTVEITPDDTYQVALSKLFNAPDKSSFNVQADQLPALGEGDVQKLIPQLLWFAAQHHQDTRTHAFVGRVLSRLSAPKEVIVDALAPQLDNRDDTVTAMVQDLLRGYEDRSATRPPDFSAYRALIEADVRAGREPQTSLVKFMYESEPGTALQTMVRACQLRKPEEIKPLLWAEHVVAELLWKRQYGFVERTAADVAVVQELEKLSRQPQWWVRLYVVEIVLAYPELGPPGVVERLLEDADPRIRESMQRAAARTDREPGKSDASPK